MFIAMLVAISTKPGVRIIMNHSLFVTRKTHNFYMSRAVKCFATEGLCSNSQARDANKHTWSTVLL